MSKNNVTPIIKHQSNVTLASVSEAINVWRLSRKKSNEKMPNYLWDQVFNLLEIEPGPDSKILAALRLARPQLEAEKQRRQPMADNESTPIEDLDFCEVNAIQEAQETSYPLTYKPAETFTTTTSVVELYRKDGALMKIHIS